MAEQLAPYQSEAMRLDERHGSRSNFRLLLEPDKSALCCRALCTQPEVGWLAIG